MMWRRGEARRPRLHIIDGAVWQRNRVRHRYQTRLRLFNILLRLVIGDDVEAGRGETASPAHHRQGRLAVASSLVSATKEDAVALFLFL